MYQYTDFDKKFVQLRAEQFRDQLERWSAVSSTDEQLCATAPAKRLAHPALRADGAHRRALWRNQQHATAHAGPHCTRLRQARHPNCWHTPKPHKTNCRTHSLANNLAAPPLRYGYGHFTTRTTCVQFNWIPLNRAADVMDLLAEREHARHPDQRQRHPQHHLRRARRYRRGQHRRHPPVRRDHAPVELAAPRIHLPAAQVQDRLQRRRRRPRCHLVGTTLACKRAGPKTAAWASP